MVEEDIVLKIFEQPKAQDVWTQHVARGWLYPLILAYGSACYAEAADLHLS